jgi:hypothetical protein
LKKPVFFKQADGRGSCDLDMNVVVGFSGSNSGAGSASLFLPFRKGGSGLCQNVSIVSIRGAFGSQLESSSYESRIIEGEEVGVDVSVDFSDQKVTMCMRKVFLFC